MVRPEYSELRALPDNGAIGIVIPGYGHPRFLVEAVTSACEQQYEGSVFVVIVDDGCLYPETAETAQALMQKWPSRLFYLRQANTRLPGARNAGIQFLLNNFPEISAIFFLDADNRIHSHSLEAYYTALKRTTGKAWAYPDINFFGMTWGTGGFDARITSETYSVLKHLVGNISEAGSLVHADVFRQGIMYDESMIYGFEDWEFWLQLLSAGYRGVRAENAGFFYRRRSESMLTDSRRTEDHIISGMRRKHKSLFSSRSVMTLEHVEAPAFAVVIEDEGIVRLFSDALLPPQTVNTAAFYALCSKWLENPDSDFFPLKTIVTTANSWQGLSENRQWLRWLFWRLRSLPQDVSSICFADGPTPSIQIEAKLEGKFHCRIYDQKLIQKMYLNMKSDQSPELKTVVACLPGSDFSEQKETLPDFDWSPAFNNSTTQIKHHSKRYAGPSAFSVRKTLAEELTAEEGREPFGVSHKRPRLMLGLSISEPRASHDKRMSDFRNQVSGSDYELTLGFEFADLDKEGSSQVSAIWNSHQVADAIPLRRVTTPLDTRTYMGREFRNLLTPEAREDGSLVVRTCDWLIAVGANGCVELMGEARSHGVRTSVLLDVDEHKPISDEDVTRLLAYEHAIKEIACDHAETRALLSGSGVPPGKIISVAELYDSIARENQ